MAEATEEVSLVPRIHRRVAEATEEVSLVPRIHRRVAEATEEGPLVPRIHHRVAADLATMRPMYLDGLSFLEDERELWRPYEALDGLTDEQLDRSVDGAHGWTGRDLIGHMVAWQELALRVAKELAVGESSAAKEQADADWDARGDAINDDLIAEWRAMPLDEVRQRLRNVAGELRGYLTVVPESRWVKHADHQSFLMAETMEHYEEHAGDLAAILAAAEQPGDR